MAEGQGLRSLVIATKVRFGTVSRTRAGPTASPRPQTSWPRWTGLHRLQTDYIDLYQVHMWDPNAPFEETLSSSTISSAAARSAPRRQNYSGWQLQKAVDMSRRNGWNLPPAGALQPPRPRGRMGAPAGMPHRRAGVILERLRGGSAVGVLARHEAPLQARAPRSPAWVGARAGSATATSRPGRYDALDAIAEETGKSAARSPSGFPLSRGHRPDHRSAPSSSTTISARPPGVERDQIARLDQASATGPYPYETHSRLT